MILEERFERAPYELIRRALRESFIRTSEKVEFIRVWDSLNFDNYEITFSPDKFTVKASHNFDDHWSEHGHTFWRAEIPKDLIQKCLDSFERSGNGELEYKTIVSKYQNWNGWHSEEEKYPYMVKVRLEKDGIGKIDGGARLMIHFQDSMEVYF